MIPHIAQSWLGIGDTDTSIGAALNRSCGSGHCRTKLCRRGRMDNRSTRVGLSLIPSLLAFGARVFGACLHQRVEDRALGDGVRTHTHLLRVERHLNRLVAQDRLEMLLYQRWRWRRSAPSEHPSHKLLRSARTQGSKQALGTPCRPHVGSIQSGK